MLLYLLLLLLCSQLYLWDSPFWLRFLHMWPHYNPTIEVVTFHLHGWCMLGVFLLLAFTCLGHECQDLMSLCDGMNECRLDLGLYSHSKEFWGNGVRTHVKSKEKIPSTWKNSPQRRIKPTVLHQAGQQAQHTTNKLLRPPVTLPNFQNSYWYSFYHSEIVLVLLFPSLGRRPLRVTLLQHKETVPASASVQ